MTNKRPFFSVVIPTTRPHYLKYSLASVLAQTYADFEVIIAFNPTTSTSTLDNLPSDPRIRVITAPALIPMHENWEVGIRAAKGQWITLLGDDDCLIADALRLASQAIVGKEKIDVLLWRWGSYIPAPANVAPVGARASMPSFSGAVNALSTADFERILYGFDPDSMSYMKLWLPSIMRAAVRSELVAQAQERSGIFCHPLTPDYGAAAQVLMLTDTLYLLDYPLVVLNHPPDSMVASSSGDKTIKEKQFYGILGHPKFKHTVVQARLETNRAVICETIALVRERYGKPAGWDIGKFFVWYNAGLMQAKAAGADTADAERELALAIAGLDESKQREVLAGIVEIKARQRVEDGAATKCGCAFVSLLRSIASKVLRHLGLIRSSVQRDGLDFRDQRMTFSDILKFTDYAGSQIRSQVRS